MPCWDEGDSHHTGLTKISYRHCDSGDLLQTATAGSRRRKGAEVRDERSQTGSEPLVSSLHRYSLKGRHLSVVRGYRVESSRIE